MNYSVHSVDPEIEKMTSEMALAFIEKIDSLFVIISNIFNSWWYKKQNVPVVEMAVRSELKIIDVNDLDTDLDIDLDDLIYVNCIISD